MPNFIIAGTGHGGLCTALHLAKAGQRVMVAERRPEAGLGYDWTDIIERGALERNGFSGLPEEHQGTAYCATIFGPSKRWPNSTGIPRDREMHIERRELLATMIADCRTAGVEFLFETEITGPMLREGKVCGLRVLRDGAKTELDADMVIDAAGWQSPVRLGLPEGSLVPRGLPPDQIFYVWRAFFDRLPGPDPEHLFRNYLCHRGFKGLSWVAANPDSMDVLMGIMGRPLTAEEIAAGLANLREDNPLLGEQILRGGQQASIPMRRPLGAFVADGYAAVGDSCCMTDPLGGSGVCSAMDQGKVLADVLLDHCRGDFSAEKLWKYQVHIFTQKPAAEAGYGTKDAQERAATDVLKNTIMTLRPQDIDLLFRCGLIAKGGIDGPKDAVTLLLQNLNHLPLMFKLAKVAGKGKKLQALVRDIPKEYDCGAVTAWVQSYEGFKMV